MINNIPASWNYSKSLEMLFLFYQCTEELLSETTPDTYALPLHNTMTLMWEIQEIFDLLVEHEGIEEYYSKYIPPIIDEFLDSLTSDHVLKRIIDKRLPMIKTGFEEAKKSHELLQRWLDALHQICTPGQYYRAYREEIIRLITNTQDKKLLMQCIARFYVCLINAGYSREYLYVSAKKYFDNKNIVIEDMNTISSFLNQYDFSRKKYNFLILMDYDLIEYLGSIIENDRLDLRIHRVSTKTELHELEKDYACKKIISEYQERLNDAKDHEKPALVRIEDMALDPHTSVAEFIDFVKSLQAYTRYFKHFYYFKQVFRVLLLDDTGYYREIKISERLHKRPYIQQNMIDLRIKNILTRKSMDKHATISIQKAIAMHSEAFDSRSTASILRTLWTATETLFSNPVTATTRENAMNSVLPIVQKTYILKRLRTLYFQLHNAVQTSALLHLGINDFQTFIIYFSKHKSDSIEMKKLYSLLSNNPLLRSRIFSIRGEMDCTESIRKMLINHGKKVEWQLQRIYRIRNIVTHLGRDVGGMHIAVIHLHNYFDYAVNYMLCKIENNDFIVSTAAVVFESQNDVRTHLEMLKKQKQLSEENYMEILFGPDPKLINYQFEF